MLRPQRISSEAPEVVPPQPDLLYVAESESHLDRFKRKKGTQYEKQLADHQSPGLDKRSPPMASDIPGNGGGYETPASVSSPRGTERAYQTPGPSYDLSPYEVQMAPNPRHGGRKVCGLITTIILVIVAFIIGGGVGGGIGGAIAVKNKDKSSSSTAPNSSATSAPASSTCSASPSVTTMIVDVAGCPNVNNATYNSTVTPYTFLQVCGTDIEPAGGQYIDVANKVESSFDACLDYCAQYTGNSTTKGQCVAATWVIFSATDPAKNSRCYLKNSTGVAVQQTTGQQFVSGYLNSA